MKRIGIVGAGGFARELRWMIRDINGDRPTWEFCGYVVSDLSKVGPNDSKDMILGDFDWLASHRAALDALVIGIGSGKARRTVGQQLRGHFPGIELPSLVHPTVRFDPDTCVIEDGVVLCAGTIATVNVRFERFCLVNLSCTIGHESIIGEGSVLNPTVNISGGVHIGAGCLIGTGAQVLQYLSVGDDER